MKTYIIHIPLIYSFTEHFVGLQNYTITGRCLCSLSCSLLALSSVLLGVLISILPPPIPTSRSCSCRSCFVYQSVTHKTFRRT